MNGLLSPAVIVQYLLRAVVVLITIPFHESAHALASHLLGDDTAVRAGRLSMNPLRHFDPLGALCMLVGGVGCAKPVSLHPYTYKHPKGGMALAAATVRGLILTVSHQEQIGALYPQVLETLVRGACRELFA